MYWSLYSQTVEAKDFDPANPRKNELLRRLLKDPFVPYEPFMKAAENVGTAAWRARDWLYYNLDNQAFDAWILDQYKREESVAEGCGCSNTSRATPRRRRDAKIPAPYATRAGISIRR